MAIDVADLEFAGGDGALVMLRPTKLRLEAEPEPRYLAPLTADLLRQRTLVRTTARPQTANLACIRSSGVGDAALELIPETQ